MRRAISDYGYDDANPTWANAYLWPEVAEIIRVRQLVSGERNEGTRPRAFDLGCGNGATANMLSQLGFDVVGVDPSESGIAIARQSFPHCQFEVAGGYDDLAARHGIFSLVVSLEVIEHCYDPRHFMRTFTDLIQPGGGRDHFHTVPRLSQEPRARPRRKMG